LGQRERVTGLPIGAEHSGLLWRGERGEEKARNTKMFNMVQKPIFVACTMLGGSQENRRWAERRTGFQGWGRVPFSASSFEDVGHVQGGNVFPFAQSHGGASSKVKVALDRAQKRPRFHMGLATTKSNGSKSKKNGSFNPQVFLEEAGVARKVSEFRRGESIFSQGDSADSVMYIQAGGVKLSVVNTQGKEAVVAMFGPTDFFGEGCMAGQALRMGTARAVAPTTVLVIGKNEMLRVLHAEHTLSDRFIAYMLVRNIRVEEDLIDQLFNSTEKRLARTLLLLARYGKKEQPDGLLTKVSQETLAEMIGTTRSRVNFFMNKFRKLGFVEYNGKIKVNKSLLTVVLHE
jgi:CRP/FNR family cyclic AMP-dependent transcriptional regulator